MFKIIAGADEAIPLMGAYEREGAAVLFTPRFAPTSGVVVRTSFTAEDGATASVNFGGGGPPPVRKPTTRIETIYPSTTTWPANMLKFYIYFSAPMSVGQAWDHLRLIEKGVKIDGAFVEIEQELWDGEGRRLTVLFDPARIKRGLVDHEEHGLPLNEGRPVTLEIDADWKDAEGAPLIEGVRREIEVAAEIRTAIDPREWKVSAPVAAREPLIVDLPRPLDHAVARRAIHVERDGVRVAGTAALERDETRWLFTPRGVWQPGVHNLVIDKFIEDLAGNKLGRLFDVDTSDPAQQGMVPDAVLMEFVVGL